MDVLPRRRRAEQRVAAARYPARSLARFRQVRETNFRFEFSLRLEAAPAMWFAGGPAHGARTCRWHDCDPAPLRQRPARSGDADPVTSALASRRFHLHCH